MGRGLSGSEVRRRELQVVLPSHLGDTILALPALRLLCETLVDWDIQPVGGPAVAGDLLEHQACGANVRTGLVGNSDGAVLLLAPSLRVALAAFLARVPIRVGLPSDYRRLFLSHPVPGLLEPLPGRRLRLLQAGEHQRDAYLRVARYATVVLGASPTVEPDGSFLLSPAVQEEGLASWRSTLQADVLLHPWAAGLQSKRWPVDRWVALARHLQDRGLRVAVSCGPSEPDRACAEAVVGALGAAPGVGPHCVRPSVWAALAQRVACVVLPDTGLAHLASAVEARSVVLFGPTDPRRHGPERGVVLQGGTGRPCWPCYQDRCAQALSPSCTVSLAADFVAQTVVSAARGAA